MDCRSPRPRVPWPISRRTSPTTSWPARLPIARARSDAEGYATALIDAAGRSVPELNVRIAGHRADLSWRDERHIVELDGPDFHQFPDHDLAIQQRWEDAGWSVDRLPAADVYDHPARLLAVVP